MEIIESKRNRLTFRQRTALVLVALVVFSAAYSRSVLAADLDPTFGTGGKVLTTLDIGSYGGGTTVSAILRYNSDGFLDSSFGPDGNGLSVVYNEGTKKMLLQPDGKFVTLPHSQFGETIGRISRLNSNGTLDFSFGSGGVALINHGGTWPNPGNDFALQADGKILVAGVRLRLCSSHRERSGLEYSAKLKRSNNRPHLRSEHRQGSAFRL